MTSWLIDPITLGRKRLSTVMLSVGVAAISIVFALPATDIASYFWIGFCLLCYFLSFRLAFTRRRCGHGFVSQRGVLIFPWVIDPCPTCGRSSFVSDVDTRDE